LEVEAEADVDMLEKVEGGGEWGKEVIRVCFALGLLLWHRSRLEWCCISAWIKQLRLNSRVKIRHAR